MRSWTLAFFSVLLSVSASATVASAGPALLFEPSNGKVLYSEDPDSQWHPASLTKIMTAYLAFEAVKAGKLKLEDTIRCSLVATLQPPSKVGLEVGGSLTVDQAVQAIIIKSANDVTVMLAEAVAGSETAFVQKMNETAHRLGMTRTTFVNTNGLPDPQQVTTARDLAKLARAVVTDFPEYAYYWTLPDMRIGKRRLGTHNALLRSFPGADGLKTGFTCDSGYNVVASASRDGRRLMAVVLGESSGNERAIRAASLLEHGFQNYGWKELFNTANIDTMPIDNNARSATSVRTTVAAWDCGNRRRKSPAGARRNKEKSAATKANAAKPAGGTAEGAPALKGSTDDQLPALKGSTEVQIPGLSTDAAASLMATPRAASFVEP